MSVVVYTIRNHYRSQLICAAMAEGIARHEKVLVKGEEYYRKPEADVAVFYGLEGNTPRIFKECSRGGHKAVYVDLGYWGRHHGGRWAGYHKVVVNDRHPTAYFRNRKHPDDRLNVFGLKFKRWRGGKHILLAGMGGKGAQAEGYLPEEWERNAIEELRKHTDRPIIYRPKPSWKAAAKIPSAHGYSSPTQPLQDALADCHAVVTHHSNVAVDGLVEGIPAFCFKGVAHPMSLQDLSKIEAPYYPENREQWAADMAYTQYSVAEMKDGTAWKYLKDEGLV